MTILIVEDETGVRQSIIRHLRTCTGYSVIGEACDGVEGLKLMEELRPDVVISEIKLPELNGPEMIKRAMDRGIRPYILLISGFSEFASAKDSMPFAVRANILKPLDMEHLTLVLRDIEKEINHEDRGRASVPQLLWGLITAGEGERERLLADLRVSERPLNDNSGVTAYLMEFGRVDSTQIADVADIIRKWVEDEVRETSYTLNLGDTVLFLLIDVSADTYFDKLMARSLLPKLLEQYDCIVAACSFKGIGQLPEQLTILKKICSGGFDFPEGQIIRELGCESDYVELVSNDRLKKSISDALKMGMLTVDLEEVESFKQEVIFSHGREDAIKQQVIDLVNLLNRDMVVHAPEKQSYVNMLIRSIFESRTKERLARYFDAFIEIVSDHDGIRANTDNAIILEAINYIRRNYTSDISLTDVAEAVKVSSVYLSRLFAKELGNNFVNFVKDFRISTAKRLLCDLNAKIKDVAEKTGFNNYKYFIRVFKDEVGMTPSEYLKQQTGRDDITE